MPSPEVALADRLGDLRPRFEFAFHPDAGAPAMACPPRHGENDPAGEQELAGCAPTSKRSLRLSQRAITALRAHKKRQAAERLAAGAAWRENNLAFCHEDTPTAGTRSAGASARSPGRQASATGTRTKDGTPPCRS